MPGLARRATAVEVDQRSDLARERVLGGELRFIVIGELRTALEVDVDDSGSAGGLGRRQLSEGLLRPLGRLLGIVEVKIDAVEGALATQRLEAQIDRLAGGAELRIRRVAQREDGKAHALDARGAIGPISAV